MRRFTVLANVRAVDGLELREVRDEDVPIFFEQQLDPEPQRMAAFTSRGPYDRDAFMAHWSRIRADASGLIRTIVVDGEVAGSVLRWRDPDLPGPEVSYWVGRDFWGRGVATGALQAFLGEATDRPIYGRCAADNIGSRRVLEKCGFRLLRRERGFANARGSEIEELIFELA